MSARARGGAATAAARAARIFGARFCRSRRCAGILGTHIRKPNTRRFRRKRFARRHRSRSAGPECSESPRVHTFRESAPQVEARGFSPAVITAVSMGFSPGQFVCCIVRLSIVFYRPFLRSAGSSARQFPGFAATLCPSYPRWCDGTRPYRRIPAPCARTARRPHPPPARPRV